MKNKALILWDIDGTLLDTNGAGVQPFQNAVKKWTSTNPNFDRKKFAGKSDYEIAHLLIGKNNLQLYRRLLIWFILRTYARSLKRKLRTEKVKVLGDVQNSLSTLKKSGFYSLGILTGNCKEGMKLKLRNAELDNYFDRKFMFYATSTKSTREMILNDVTSRYKGVIITVGDTPNDILAARNLGIQNISVATGLYSREELEGLNPDWVLETNWNFSDFKVKLEKLSEELNEK